MSQNGGRVVSWEGAKKKGGGGGCSKPGRWERWYDNEVARLER